YLPSSTRRRRSCTTSLLLVLVGPSPPETSAPHDRQNRLFSGIGVWQRKHSSTPLVIGGAVLRRAGRSAPAPCDDAQRPEPQRGSPAWEGPETRRSCRCRWRRASARPRNPRRRRSRDRKSVV